MRRERGGVANANAFNYDSRKKRKMGDEKADDRMRMIRIPFGGWQDDH